MPSSKAAELEVFYKPVDAKQGKKLEDGQELACTAGQTLTGLGKETIHVRAWLLKVITFTRLQLLLLCLVIG